MFCPGAAGLQAARQREAEPCSTVWYSGQRFHEFRRLRGFGARRSSSSIVLGAVGTHSPTDTCQSGNSALTNIELRTGVQQPVGTAGAGPAGLQLQAEGLSNTTGPSRGEK